MPNDPVSVQDARREPTPHMFNAFHWRRVGQQGAKAGKPLAELATHNAAVNAWIKEGYHGRK